MTISAADTMAMEQATDERSRIFVTGLLVASVLPFLIFGLSDAHPVGATAATANAAWLFGTAHVALTGFLWFDSRYRDHIQARPAYFYLLPLALTIACLAGVLAAGTSGLVAFQAAFIIWLLHHFGRQNWGVICLTATGTRSDRASQLERHLCNWAPVVAALGTSDVLAALAWTGWTNEIRTAGFALTGAASATALAIAIAQLRKGVAPLRIAMTAIVGLFFLPIFLMPAGLSAVGTAHAFQYAVVIGCVAAAQKASPRLWTLPLTLLVLIYISLYGLLRVAGPILSGSIAATLVVIWQMIIVWHFLIDADVWRLRQPFQRQAIRESLSFLFRPSRS